MVEDFLVSVALITALSTGIPAVIGAIIALIQAFKAKSTATVAQGVAANASKTINSHVYTIQDQPTQTEEFHNE
jgi:hypothetical protein